MASKVASKESKAALKSLQKSVRKELKKKALLGQYAIVNRDGKACRVLASELIKEMDSAEKTRS